MGCKQLQFNDYFTLQAMLDAVVKSLESENKEAVYKNK